MLIAYDPIYRRPGNLEVQRQMGGTMPEEVLRKLFPEETWVSMTWLMTLYEASEQELVQASIEHMSSETQAVDDLP